MTMLVNIETRTVLSLEEVKVRVPGWAPPDPPSPESLKDSGWAILEYDERPSSDAVPGPLRNENGRIIQSWQKAERTPEQWAIWISDRRYQSEIGGIELSGMRVDTDDRSKLLINGAATRAARDSSYVLKWKTAEGFIDIPAEQVMIMADAVSDHVQACFNREAELQAAVADSSITAEMLEEGWPS